MIEGNFIVIEGIDGAGTTLQARLLVDWFHQRGLPCHQTHEPTDGPVGSLIRQVLTNRLVVRGITGPRAPGWATMALLFAADRLDHLEAEIRPNLADGVSVVCDRYDLSSLAYQSATSEDSDGPPTVEWVRSMNNKARRPDLTIVLDVDPAIASRRRRERSSSVELYEEGDLQIHLAEVYKTAERLVPNDRLVHLDGNQKPDVVHEAIIAEVMKLRHG